MTLERDGVVWLEAETSRYDGTDIVLSLPERTASLDVVPVPVVVVWTTPRGVFRMEATAHQRAGEYRLSPLTAADRIQRRAHPRLPVGAPMRLSSATGTSPAMLMDISEAALRARLALPTAAGLEAGNEVRVAFTLHETGFVLDGTVLREQGGDEPDTVDLIVVLDIPARTANDLRRSVALTRAEREQHP